jgi:diadenosine tetraphosphate (Ap4A) HIT family hydrolase
MPSSRPSVTADEVGKDADCPFCPGHLTASTADADTLLACGPGVNLLPTVGMMVPGYLLVTTQEHVLSMGDLGARHLEDLGPWLDEVRSILAPRFGEYLTFEHGSSVADRTGACIEHAHLHLIPLAEQLSERLRSAASWTILPGFPDLANYGGASYAYLHVSGDHLALAEPGLGSQWIRREAGKHLDRDDWDWSLQWDEQQLKETLYRIDKLGLRAHLARAGRHLAGP